MKIIAISGKKGSGKDTLADFIGGPVWSFADPLKEAVLKLFGGSFGDLSPNLWGESSGRSHVLRDGLTVRDLIAKTSEFLHEVDKAWGARAAVTELTYGDYESVVIPDLRLRKEIRLLDILEHAGHFVYLVRLEREGVDATDTSRYETELDGFTLWDLVVQNNGSLDDLKVAAGEIRRRAGWEER